MKRYLVAAATLLVLVLAIVAFAQLPPPPGGDRQPVRINPVPVPPVMITSGDSLFILRGDQLLKVRASDLQVVQETMLPRPKPQNPPPPEDGK